MAAPVLYPGSIERTSIAEADEEKGFLIVEVAAHESDVRVDWRFRRLPARPLVRRDLHLAELADDRLESTIRSFVADAPADAVLTIRVVGAITELAARVLSATYLRAVAPASMNIELRMADGEEAEIRPMRKPTESDRVLELPL